MSYLQDFCGGTGTSATGPELIGDNLIDVSRGFGSAKRFLSVDSKGSLRGAPVKRTPCRTQKVVPHYVIHLKARTETLKRSVMLRPRGDASSLINHASGPTFPSVLQDFAL